MARIFVTGSSDGLGARAAQLLAAGGHDVVLHARNDERAAEAMRRTPQARDVLIADIISLRGAFRLADLANRAGRFDAVIHNAAVFHRVEHAPNEDGLAPTFAVNALAPYVLTAAMLRPRRLIYLSSDMHASGRADFSDLGWTQRKWDGTQAYSDSKLFDTMLAFGLARRWPDVLSNAVDPGWVATKMGGPSAPGDLESGASTQVWLASSDNGEALVTGKLFHQMRQQPASPDARNPALQDELLERLAVLSGMRLRA